MPASIPSGLALGDGLTDRLGLGLFDGLTLEDGDALADGDSEGDDLNTLIVGVTEYVTFVVAPFNRTLNVNVSAFVRSVSMSSTV